MESKPASSKAPLSVARILQIIKVLSQSDDPLSLAELSRKLTTPKTSLIGLLRGLIDMLSCVSDEMVQGITGMAAPIRDNSSKVLGALIVTGPTGRIKDDHLALETALLTSARQISASLGYRETADA